MIGLVKKSLLTAALSVGLSLIAAPAFAQVKCGGKGEPPCEPPKGIPCSPGYWKNHISEWYNIEGICSAATSPSCVTLLNALTCKGADATCGRSAAAAYLNNLTGCTE
jgi:hypothetical protein